MLVAVIATFCLTMEPDVCVQELISDQATLSECTMVAESYIQVWMENHPKYRENWNLDKWGCVIGYVKGHDI